MWCIILHYITGKSFVEFAPHLDEYSVLSTSKILLRLSRQFQQFFKNNFSRIKNMPQVKTNNFHPLRNFLTEKLLRGWKLLVFPGGTFFMSQKLFLKKFWNCLDTLNNNTTDVYPLQVPYEEFICMHLFLFVRIIFSIKILSKLKTQIKNIDTFILRHKRCK